MNKGEYPLAAAVKQGEVSERTQTLEVFYPVTKNSRASQGREIKGS